MIRSHLSRAAMLIGMGLSASLAAASAAEKSKPNVLVIITDDQRYDALSCEGHPILKTPYLDRLAQEGARFTRAFVTTSLCSPSRASMLSGLYAHRHGVQNNFTEYPDALPSYPKRLREAGYETAYIGKWHMGETNAAPRSGFDFWMSHAGQGRYFDNEWNINGQSKFIKGYYTTVLTDHVVQWLKQPHTRPFALTVGQKAPHGGPIEPEEKFERAFDTSPIARPVNSEAWGGDKPEWLAESYPTWHGAGGPLYNYFTYERFVRAYLGTLLSVDESIGRIYEALRETGQLDNTVIVFTSDNGFALTEHGRVDKRTMYEESIRVPLLVRYPPLIPAGTVVTQMVLNLDLAPTLVDLGGGRKLPNIDGQSWKPLLQGKDRGWRKSFLYFYNYEEEFPYTPNVRGIRTDRWKFIRYPHGDGGPDRYSAELYDLVQDPWEMKDLAREKAHATKVAELQKEFERLMRKHKALPDRMPIDKGIINVLPRF